MSGPLTVSLLGHPEIVLDGQRVIFRTRKAEALLIYLLVEGSARARASLADLFWPGADAGHGRMMLRTTLAHLRRALDGHGGSAADRAGTGDRGTVIAQGDTLALQLPPHTFVDLHLISSALQALNDANPAADDGLRQRVVDQLRAAAAGYRGDFLAGFSVDDAPDFDNWVSAQREYWHRQMSQVLEGLSRLLAEGGQVRQALEAAGRWMTHDPWSEAARQRAMELQLATGNPVAAREVYESYRRLLAEELGTTPGPHLAELAARVPGPRGSDMLPADTLISASALPMVDTLPAFLPLVGRGRELASLVAAYRAARAGVPQAVVLTGPAGIGKTRLAAAFLSWVAAAGGDALHGRALEARTGLPYHPVTDALRERLEHVNAPEDLLEDVWLSEASRLFPELRERYEDLPAPAADEATARARLFEAVARLVQALARQAAQRTQAALVLFLDDMQNADATSLDLLLYAAQRWTDAHTPLLLLLAVRQDTPAPAGLIAAPETAAAWLPALGRSLPLTRLVLPPLNAEQVLEVIQVLAGAHHLAPGTEQTHLQPTGAWLFRETAGHPFFLAETLKLLLDHGLLAPRLAPGGERTLDFAAAARAIEAQAVVLEIPPSVREMILARLASLDLPALDVLAAAAVLGEPVNFDALRQVAELSEAAALGALDALLRRDLLRPAGADYLFSHDKVREVIYDESGEARRRVFHRRALAALEASTRASAAELARHALAAGSSDKAFGYSVAAGDDALRLFAARDAVRHYETALGLLGLPAAAAPVTPPDDLEESLYQGLGRAYELLEAWDKAVEVYRRQVAIGRRDAKPRLAWAGLNRLAKLCIWSGFRLAEAEDLLRQAWAAAEESDDRLGMAETAWGRAQVRMYLYHPAAVEDAQQALALAHESASSELVARCLNVLAHAQTGAGRWDESLVPAEEARHRYVALGDWAMEVDCLALLALARANLGQIHDALHLARQAQARAAQIGTRWAQTFAGAVLAMILAELGLCGEALASGRHAAALADELAFPPLVRLARSALASVELALGAAESAYRNLQAAGRAHAEAGAGAAMTDLLASLCCAACALQGDWAAALDFAHQARTARDPAVTISASSPLFLETEALLRGGEEAEAEEGLVRLREHIHTSPVRKLAYLRAHAVWCRHQGRAGEAILDLAAAWDLANALSLRRDEWQILSELAGLYEGTGNGMAASEARNRSAGIRGVLAASIEDAQLRAVFVARASAYPEFAAERTS